MIETWPVNGINPAVRWFFVIAHFSWLICGSRILCVPRSSTRQPESAAPPRGIYTIMILTSKTGRTIELDERQRADFEEVSKARGENCARAAAFSGLLPGQISPEVMAARQQARAASRAARRQRLERVQVEARRYAAVVESLRQISPEIHKYAATHILNRGRQLLPGHQFRHHPAVRIPTPWRHLHPQERAEAVRTVYRILGKLKKRDRQKLRLLLAPGEFARFLKRANPMVLAELL